MNRDRALDLLYPPHCPICEKYIYQKRGTDRIALVCPSCAQKIARVGDRFCLKCGKPVASAQEEFCADCRRRGHAFAQGRSVFVYRDGIRDSLCRFKYENKKEYARFYAAAMAAALGGWIRAQQIDCIMPVPLHEKRQRQRGYNQAELIALRLGEQLGIPVETDILVRTRATLPQKGLSGEQRRRNMEGVFALRAQPREGLTVLLVDDIYTTGTTMDAAAAVLLRAGAGAVYAACAATGG